MITLVTLKWLTPNAFVSRFAMTVERCVVRRNADKLTAVGIISGLAKQSLMKVSTTVIAACMIQS